MANAPCNLDHVYLKGDMGIEVKNHQPFYRDKKKIRTRSLAEAKLQQFVMIILCNSQ